jgi:hypothetical protein
MVEQTRTYVDLTLVLEPDFLTKIRDPFPLVYHRLQM